MSEFHPEPEGQGTHLHPVIIRGCNIQYSTGKIYSPDKRRISPQGLFHSPSQKIGQHEEIDLILNVFPVDIP
jgi:hypothetical protein